MRPSINKLRVFAAVLLLAAGSGAAVETLLFDPSATPNVSYAIRAGTNSGSYQVSLGIGTNTAAILTNGPWGRIFCTAVAIATNGMESLPSNELLCTNRPWAPLALRLGKIQDGYILMVTADGSASWQYLAYITNRPVSLTLSQRAALFRIAASNPPPFPR